MRVVVNLPGMMEADLKHFPGREIPAKGLVLFRNQDSDAEYQYVLRWTNPFTGIGAIGIYMTEEECRDLTKHFERVASV